MLDLKFVRENLDKVAEAMKNRHTEVDLDAFRKLDQERRDLLQEVEADKSMRNSVSAEISKMKKNGEDASEKILSMRTLGDKIAETDKKLKEVEQGLRDIMLTIPNMPDASVPVGKDDTENPEVRKWGEPTHFDFEPKAHWDLGKTWASSIPIGQPRFRAVVSIIIWAWGPVWNVRSITSCLISTPKRRLYGSHPALYRQSGDHDRYRSTPKISRRYVSP